MSPNTSEVPTSGNVPRCYGWTEVYAPTGAEAAAFDRWAIDDQGVSSGVLMENAGRSAALVLGRLYHDDPVIVLAGPGNNGGDGLVLARSLAIQGRDVRVLTTGDRPGQDPLLHGWPISVEPSPDDEALLSAAMDSAGVIVDALLGTGIRGAPRDPHARVIRSLNRAGAPVFSLDVPSGVDADTGAVQGEAVRADATVAFGAPKLGTLLFPGRERSGRLIAVEIGFPPIRSRSIGVRLITPGWAEAHRPRRALVTHKKAEGRLLILAGAPGLAGAAVLAARGALRAGAGYVRVASHAANREILQSGVPEALFVDVSDPDALAAAVSECDALAAGPGMGIDDAAAKRLNEILQADGLPGVVLDADALTLLGEGKLPAFSGAAKANRRLLTPHPGEMARLGAGPAEIQADPVLACRDGAARWASSLLLKGQPSLISAEEGGAVWMSTGGSSDLARAGVGDVLTGVAGAFMARGSDAMTAGALALHFTGRAAALSGRHETLLPSDIADHLAGAFRDPLSRISDLGLPFVTLDLDPPH
jgi:NAD(P)H-hydrate epimerase